MNTILGAKQELLISRIGDVDGGQLIMALLATARKIDAACAALLAEHDLSEGRLAALLAISAEPGVAPGALAERLQVTRATVTGLVDGLERQALVERGGSTGDRRSLTLRATPTGEKLITALAPQYSQWLGHLGGGISADDHEVIMRAMTAIQRNLGSEASDG